MNRSLYQQVDLDPDQVCLRFRNFERKGNGVRLILLAEIYSILVTDEKIVELVRSIIDALELPVHSQVCLIYSHRVQILVGCVFNVDYEDSLALFQVFAQGENEIFDSLRLSTS